MKSFDFSNKAHSDLTVKTALGGYLAICSFMVMLALFVNEFLYFLQVEREDRVVLESSFFRAKDLNITLQIHLPKMPCGVVALNVVDKDAKGNHAHSTDGIYKRRSLAPGAKNLGASRTGVEFLRGEQAIGCMPCYDVVECCRTCEDVKNSWLRRGKALPTDYVFEQCLKELYAAHPVQDGESCFIDAFLNLKQVNARLEIGLLGNDTAIFPPHWNDNELDFSHTIDVLRFGDDFPGLQNILSAREKHLHEKGAMDYYQYDLHLIPTTFASAAGETLYSHQYSATELFKAVRLDTLTPGIYIQYDITPFTAEVTEKRKPFLQFVTQCCALIGGIFAFSRMVDGFGYSLARAAAKRLVRRSGSTIADHVQ
jgi:hypothetical protein